jgi:hypothetical protein
LSGRRAEMPLCSAFPGQHSLKTLR